MQTEIGTAVGPSQDRKLAISSVSPPAFVFDHGAASVPDLEAAIGWYKKILGFELVRRFALPDANAQCAMLIRGNLRMELFEPRNSVLLPEARRHPNSDVQLHGNKHVAFRTNNIRVLIEWFRSNEVEFALELSSAFGDAVFIRDNAGNLIEFLCRRRSLPEK